MARPPKFPPHQPFRVLAKRVRAAASKATSEADEPQAKRAGTEDGTEELVFSRAVASLGVEALPPGNRRVGAAARGRRPVVPPVPEFVVHEEEGWVEGYRRELGPRVIARLRGRPRATLDLHGVRVASARSRVSGFLARARAGTVVLIVVGKGRHSPNGQGVLVREIGAWLSSGSSARRVVAFCTAPPELGGSGGVLVLLDAPLADKT